MPSYGLSDAAAGPGYLRAVAGLAVREDCPGGCCDGGGGDEPFWKMATACCPQGDYADVVFLPATEVCNVVAIAGSCYQVQHGVLFVNCANLTDDEFEALPDNVVCLPDGPYLFYRAGEYTCAGTCQDAVCSPCPPVADCCVGPLNNQCGARLPVGGGSTARIHCNVKSTRRWAHDCDGFNVLLDTYTGRDVRDHGSGDCSWGGLVTIPGGNRVQGWTDGTLEFDETYDFTISPKVYLSGGRPFPERTCAGSGTMSTVSPPALDLVFAELECAARINLTGNSSFGINGPYPEPNMETVVCRTGIIRGGKCAGMLGAWGTLTGSHVRGQFDTCPGSVERVSVRVFAMMSTSKTAPCGGTSPDDGEIPDPGVAAAVAAQVAAMGKGCCG